ncbi:hypothetical protein D3C76_1611740 [compost metagenome]
MHVFNKPDIEPPVQGELQKISDFIVIDPFDQHHIQLHGIKSRPQGGIHTGQHLLDIAASCNQTEAVLTQAVQADVNPGKPGLLQCFRFFL